jgi:glycosyltransferase involved in cell wall biosynthesis
MITFVIPTLNRAENLRICVESIAQQNPHKIVISDNNSSDGTAAVARELREKYPFVVYCKRETTGDFPDSFKSAVLNSDSEWTWTFGDDDVLLPGALKFVSEFIGKSNTEFLHVAEQKRVGNPCVIQGTFLDLCSRYGWLDMTGFISGNVMKTDRLKEAVNSEFWDVYATSSFPHSLCLLEKFKDSVSALIECPVIETQSDKPTEATIKRWSESKTTYRYLLVADGLKTLADNGMIPLKLNEDFFRYLDSSVLFRLMHDLVVRSLEGADPPNEEDLQRLVYITSVIDGPRGVELLAWSQKCTSLMRENIEVVAKMRSAHFSLVGEASSMALPSYGVQYIYDKEVSKCH